MTKLILQIDTATGLVEAIDHAGKTTGVHGVGAGTIASVSTANKSIYVDKEATGAADGTSWADAFTTIQDAINSMEDVVIHAYTIYVRDGTKKTGTADENTANHLVDDGNSQFVSGDVGKRVFNITDSTWGVVGSYVDAGDLGIVDITGANLDLFPDGDEDYVIEATPYRETVYLNSLPATHPTHAMLGSLTIRAEYYWQGDCEAQVNAGEILDTSADFTNVEVGDRVYVLDLNGANGRAQDYEYGTVDDVSQVGADIVRTTLAKTPTANWKYVIVKTEISGSDDGLDGGTARANCFISNLMDGFNIHGFYMTFADLYTVQITTGLSCAVNYNILENCDRGFFFSNCSRVTAYYDYISAIENYSVLLYSQTTALVRWCVVATGAGAAATSAFYQSYMEIGWCVLDAGNRGLRSNYLGFMHIRYSTITANVAIGLVVIYNSAIQTTLSTNNGIIPEDPVGTIEGAFIG